MKYVTIIGMENFDLKRFSHIGDAVWELFVRENVVFETKSLNKMHKMTTSFVNASFQAKAAEIILSELLNQEEKEIFRRARNLPLGVSKKSNPDAHRHATAFEAIVGYFYLHDKERLNKLFEIVKKSLIAKEN